MPGIVYVSESIKGCLPKVYDDLEDVLGWDIGTIPLTSNIWCRDFMPVPTGDWYTKFAYKKDVAQYPQLEVHKLSWDWLDGIVQSDIVLDGGNVVFSSDAKIALVTDKVFIDNPGWHSSRLTGELTDLLQVNRIVFLPIEPGDTLGHADGIARFIDDLAVFVNDYSCLCDPIFRGYQELLYARLEKAGISPIPFPFAYDLCDDSNEAENKFRTQFPVMDEWNPAFGYYINFVKHDDKVVVPAFGHPKDDAAAIMVEGAFHGVNVDTVDCSELSMLGGLLNCITWQD